MVENLTNMGGMPGIGLLEGRGIEGSPPPKGE